MTNQNPRPRRPAQALHSSLDAELPDGFMLIHGDCVDVLKMLRPASIDAVVTDPPYGIRIMGQAWDGDDITRRTKRRRSVQSADTGRRAAKRKRNGGYRSTAAEAGKYARGLEANRAFGKWCEEWLTECLRVLKPGGHLVASCAPRTAHRLVCAAEDVGFEVRDSVIWLFGSGFPKNHNVGRLLGGTWNGWGTALKPLHEPILLARKPVVGTVANNVATHGTGALNIGGCRLTDGDRWPANVILDEHAAALVDAQSSERPAGAHPAKRAGLGSARTLPSTSRGTAAAERRDLGAGGASRFFYVSKASKTEREAGLSARGNGHPTVKPVDLMRQLCRLVTPPNGVILDPFAGTATTGCAVAVENAERGTAWSFVGIERDSEYFEVARGRLLHWSTVDADAPVMQERRRRPREGAATIRRRWLGLFAPRT